MRRRFCATMRRPAFSITALMPPVRLRAVASGLMIENVRSTAIGVLSGRFWVDGLIETMLARGKAALPYRAAGTVSVNCAWNATAPLLLPAFGRAQARRAALGHDKRSTRCAALILSRAVISASHRAKMNIPSLADFLLNIHHQRCVIT